MKPPDGKEKAIPTTEIALNHAGNATKMNTADSSCGSVKLPPIRSVRDLLIADLPVRPEVIRGILRQRCKMGLGGAAKARKTWQLMDLAISLSQGTPWLGWETVKTKVLYVNLELYDDTFRQRLGMICEAKEAPLEEVQDGIDHWGLRGYAGSYEAMVPIIIEQAKDKGYGAIIIDPQYKILGDADENRAGDMTKLYNRLDEICRDTGAAVIMAQHYGKGSKASTQDGDRVRGSSTTIGDMDAGIEFVAQDEADDTNHILAVKGKLREFPPFEPFCIEWDGKALFNVSDHDPSKLKDKSGRPSDYSAKQILEAMGGAGQPLTKKEIKDICIKEVGMSQPTFYNLWSEIWPKGASESEHVLYNREAKTYTVHGIGLN